MLKNSTSSSDGRSFMNVFFSFKSPSTPWHVSALGFWPRDLKIFSRRLICPCVSLRCCTKAFLISRSELSPAICSSAPSSMCSAEYMSFSSCSNSSSMVCIAMRPPVSNTNVWGCRQAGAARAVLCWNLCGQQNAAGLQPHQTRQRNVRPVGPVVQLVPEFVERLVQREQLQQGLEVRCTRRDRKSTR